MATTDSIEIFVGIDVSRLRSAILRSATGCWRRPTGSTPECWPSLPASGGRGPGGGPTRCGRLWPSG